MVNVKLENIVENTSYTFIWMCSVFILRREYTQMGKNSAALLGFFTFMILTPLIVLLVDTTSGINESNLRYVLMIISLFLNVFLVVFIIVKRIDVDYTKSASSDNYHQLLGSYIVDDESIEDVDKIWEKWDTQAEESVSVIERENIKSINIKGTKEITESEGNIVYYIIEINYGKTQNLKREVLRRYREFFEMYSDLKAANSSVEFPVFPLITNTRKDVTAEVIKKREKAFNELLQLILVKKLHSRGLSRFLSNKSEIDITGINKRERVMSTIQDTTFTVAITKAVKEEGKFFTHASYEINTKCGLHVIKSAHRFDDFKILYKSLKSKYLIANEFPESYLIKSSVDPKIVKERKIMLQALLTSLIENPVTKSDPEVVKFLNLDTII